VTGAERAQLARTFGVRLATERRQVGLTQDALAARAKYSSAHVARLERGERRPTDSTTWRLAKAIVDARQGNMAATAELDVALMMAGGDSCGCCIELGSGWPGRG
jgi:predicted transcriptional regulator